MNGGGNTLQKLLDTAKVELITKLIAVNTYIKKDLKSITQASTVRNYKEMKLKPSEKNIKIKPVKNERENRRIKIKETKSFSLKR